MDRLAPGGSAAWRSRALREALIALVGGAVGACSGRAMVQAALEHQRPRGRAVVLAVGKAAMSMVEGAREAWAGHLDRGLVVTKDGGARGFAPPGFEILWASHPLPDARSEAAADAALAFVRRLTPEDHLLVLLSGGTSSLLGAPVPPLTRAELATTYEALLGAGVVVEDINAVRAVVSRAGGGRLAAACRAMVDVLVLSDVLSVTAQGGDPAHVGSGPFARPHDPERAAEVLDRVVGVPRRVHEVVRRGVPRGCPAIPHRVVASHQTLLDAVATRLEAEGWGVRRLAPSDAPLGEHADRLAAAAASLAPGEALVTGGEPAVTLPPRPGAGGRNLHLALELARRLDGDEGVAAAILASDGNDGTSDRAGAAVDGFSWSHLQEIGDPSRALARFDSETALAGAGLAVRWGDTGSNLLDVHVVGRGHPGD